MTNVQPSPAAARPTGRTPFGAGIRLGHVSGVQIQADWSVLIIFALIAMSLATASFPIWHPAWTPALRWAVALAAAVLFLVSILLHELSHALVARSRGLAVPRITLFLFGGVAEMAGEPRSPKDEFLIAAVGPAVSLVLGASAWLLGSLLAAPAIAAATLAEPAATMARVGPLATLLLWLGPVNVILGVFNLVPGFPLDGGRVLRAFLWWTTGDLVRASRWASRAGQLFAFVLMGLGVWDLLVGGLTQGLWLLLIGWFLNNAARMSYHRLLIRRALEGVPVRELMFTRLERVPPELPVRQLVEEYFMRSDQRAFAVAENEQLLGLVGLDAVRRLPRERWQDTTVRALMTPVRDLPALQPEADAERALEVMTQRDLDQVAVVRDGTLLGLVRRRDVMKWLSLHDAGLAGA